MANFMIPKFLNKSLLALILVVVSFGLFVAPAAKTLAFHEEPNASEVIESLQTDEADQTQQLETLETDSSPPTISDETAPGQAVTCEGSFVGLGWLLCKISQGIYQAFDWAVNDILAEHLLEIDLIEDNQELRSAWVSFKNITNVMFLIVFLVIIYAEASGRVGALETFSATRLLPRLAVAVIGLQISYWLIGYTIAVFNDIGAGVAQIVLSPVDGMSGFEFSGIFAPFTNGSTFWGIPLGYSGDFVDNLAAIPAFVAGGIGLLAIYDTVLLYAIIGLLLLLLTLIARKLIVVALVITAPFAFVMYVLPSTEKYFKQWWDAFLTTLGMYPIIMVFIASGSLLGRLAVSGDDVSVFNSMVAIIATFLPFFLIPLTFRFAGKAMVAVTSGLTNVSNKAKGDARDPNSMRSHLKQKRGQRYGRLMNGQARVPGTSQTIVPRTVRRAWNRIPGVDSTASMMTDIIQGRKDRDNILATGSDDVIRAAAVTGGGRKKGVGVGLAGGGSALSGEIVFGKHLAYNSDGTVMHRNGVAQLDNGNGTTDDATAGDFYDKDVMSQVRKFSSNLGFQHVSSEYAMGRAMSVADQSQVWAGLDATRWTKSEKVGMANALGFETKNDSLHNKNGDFGKYFHEGSYDVSDNRAMPLKFGKTIDGIDKTVSAFDLGKQKGPFWQTVTKGLDEFAISKGVNRGMSESQKINATGLDEYNQINNLAWKARSLVNSAQAFGGGGASFDDDGAPAGDSGGRMFGSGAVGEAARGAEAFLAAYEKHFGRLPDTSGVGEKIRPSK